MKIHAYILCYNESKMIRHTLNHYQQFCSQITVIDNRSTDNTKDIILKEYPKVGIQLSVTDNVFNDGVHKQIKNNIWKNSTADWVIVCDMDELLWHPNLLQRLKAMQEKGYVLPLVIGYNMFSETFPDNYNLPITSQIKHGVRAYNFDKQIIFNPKAIVEMNFSDGAHHFAPKLKNGTRMDLPKTALYLLHYKYMSEHYLIDKHNNYSTRMSEYNKEHGFGAEYEKGEAHVKECFNALRNCGKIEQIIP